jgi:hypothetical protein
MSDNSRKATKKNTEQPGSRGRSDQQATTLFTESNLHQTNLEENVVLTQGKENDAIPIADR